MSNSTNILPLLVLFNMDETLIPYSVDCDTDSPFVKSEEFIRDKYGKIITHFPEVPVIFERLQQDGIEIAIAANPNDVNGTNQLIKLFGWDKYVTYTEVSPDLQSCLIQQIQRKSQVPYDKMIFFDSHEVTAECIQSTLGVLSIYVNPKCGMTLKALDEGFRRYEIKQLANISEQAELAKETSPAG